MTDGYLKARNTMKILWSFWVWYWKKIILLQTYHAYIGNLSVFKQVFRKLLLVIV